MRKLGQVIKPQNTALYIVKKYQQIINIKSLKTNLTRQLQKYI
jgi:hypothetical protein